MSNRLSSVGALGYQGTNAASPPNVTISEFAPTTTDYKNHSIGDIWIYVNRNTNPYTSTPYILLSLYQQTATWSQIDASDNGILTLTGNAGGAVGPDAGNDVSLVGSGGITVTGSPGSNTLTISSTTITWNVITDPTATMVVNQGYIANNGAGVTLTLPATASVGDEIKIALINAAGVTIAQNAGQTIHWLGKDTTTGVGGSLASSENYDSLTMLCTTTDTDWVVIEGNGNWTVV